MGSLLGVSESAGLVERPVGPEGECCANDPCVPDESSHTGGGVNGVDGVSKIVFAEACAVESVRAGSQGQVRDRYALIVRRNGHSRANSRSRAGVYADEFAEAACTERATDGCAVERVPRHLSCERTCILSRKEFTNSGIARTYVMTFVSMVFMKSRIM
jgi:hypothetical protein